MAPNDTGSPVRGRHSQQAVKQRQAEEAARLQEEREHAHEALRAAQERGDISIPRRRTSHKWIVVLLVLAALALGVFFCRSYIADFAHSRGIDIPFLAGSHASSENPSGTSSGAQAGSSSGSQASTAQASSQASAKASASSAAHSNQAPSATSGSGASAPAASFDLATANLSAIPRSEGFGGFSLAAGAEAPIPTPSARDAIGTAYADIEDAGDCGFVFMNLKTGRGLCYNSGTPIYSASAFKAPYVYYLLANAEQGALLSDDDRANIEAALVNSDNDAYDALHYAHDTQDYYSWLASHGVTDDPYYGFYPNIDAATMAQLWCEVYQYLESGTDEAKWMKDLLAHTSVSFIRDGLADDDVTVWDKGGWISDEDGTAVNDAGVVEGADGSRYVMVVLTGQDNGGESQRRVGALAKALYDARGALE